MHELGEPGFKTVLFGSCLTLGHMLHWWVGEFSFIICRLGIVIMSRVYFTKEA